MYNHIFPITYLQKNLAEELDETEIINLISDMEKDRLTDPRLIENKAGNWMTFDKLLLTKRYKHSKLTSVVRNYLNQYRAEILGVVKNELEITESWVNFCQKGRGHHIHNHFNSVVSGTFYLDVPEDSGGQLVIVDNRNRGSIQQYAEPNYHNVTEIYITPKKYDLILFSSNMYHYVTPNASDSMRKSLAFNSFYKHAISADPEGYSCTGIDFQLNTP